MNIEIPISNLLLAPSGERPLEISITTAPASCPLYAKNKNEKICHCSEISKKNKKYFH